MIRLNKELVNEFQEWEQSDEDLIEKLVGLLAPEVPSERARTATLLSLGSHFSDEDFLPRPQVHVLLIGGSIPYRILDWVEENIERAEQIPSYDENIGSKSKLKQLHRDGNYVISVNDLDEYSSELYHRLHNVMTNSSSDDLQSTYECTVVASARNSSKIPIRVMNEFDFIIRVRSPDEEQQFESSSQVLDSLFDSLNSQSKSSLPNNVESKLNHYIKWNRPYRPTFDDEKTKENIKRINKRLVAGKTRSFYQVHKPYLRTAYSIAKLNREDLKTAHYYRAIAIHQDESLEKVKERYTHQEPVELDSSTPYIDNSSDVISRLVDLRDNQFEELIAELWEHRGWNVELTPKQDRGIDIVAEKYEPYHRKELIQAKKYDNQPVSSEEIQQYASLKHQQRNADLVVVVTTSEFSKNAQELAEQLNVKLVNGVALTNIINDLGYSDRIE